MSLEPLRSLVSAALRAGARVASPFGEATAERVTLTFVADLVRQLDGEASGRLGLDAASGLVEGDLGLFGLLLGAAPTLRDATTLACSTFALLHDTARLELEVEGRLAKLRLVPDPAHPVPPALAEFAMVAVSRISRRLSGRELRPTGVTFTHAASRPTRDLEAFFGAPVIFGHHEIAMTFPAIYLDLSLPGGDAGRLAPLLAHARRILDARPRAESFISYVRQEIVRGMERGEHRLDLVAERLGVDARTLQRRLRALRSTYGEILDAARREHALYAADNRLPANEIARRVGLPDRAAFARAFRRWTNGTPRSYARAKKTSSTAIGI